MYLDSLKRVNGTFRAARPLRVTLAWWTRVITRCRRPPGCPALRGPCRQPGTRWRCRRGAGSLVVPGAAGGAGSTGNLPPANLTRPEETACEQTDAERTERVSPPFPGAQRPPQTRGQTQRRDPPFRPPGPGSGLSRAAGLAPGHRPCRSGRASWGRGPQACPRALCLGSRPVRTGRFDHPPGPLPHGQVLGPGDLR